MSLGFCHRQVIKLGEGYIVNTDVLIKNSTSLLLSTSTKGRWSWGFEAAIMTQNRGVYRQSILRGNKDRFNTCCIIVAVRFKLLFETLTTTNAKWYREHNLSLSIFSPRGNSELERHHPSSLLGQRILTGMEMDWKRWLELLIGTQP